MYNITVIAKHIIWLRNSGQPVTHMELQKLVYYAQAWYLAINDKLLFPDDFEAWIYGPVSPKLYQEYKEFGNGFINIDLDPEKPPIPNSRDKDIFEFLEEVVSIYSKYNAVELMEMSHRELPWVKARKGLDIDVPCDNIISKDDMKGYFKRRINRGKKKKAQRQDITY